MFWVQLIFNQDVSDKIVQCHRFPRTNFIQNDFHNRKTLAGIGYTLCVCVSAHRTIWPFKVIFLVKVRSCVLIENESIPPTGNCTNSIYWFFFLLSFQQSKKPKMPELTELVNETPAKVEETQARIEDDDDDDSDTTIPELEDTGEWAAIKWRNLQMIDLIFLSSILLSRQHSCAIGQGSRWSSRFGFESKTIAWRKEGT